MSTWHTLGDTLALIWRGVAPQFTVLEPQAGSWVLGRDTAGIEDDRVSRRHCQVTRVGEGWKFVDLGSANGTFLDGQRVEGTVVRPHWEILQIGRSLIMPLSGAGAQPQVVEVEGGFVGPGLAAAWEAVAEAGRQGAHLLLVGPRGSGLAPLVRHYVRSRGRAGERLSVVTSSDGLAPEAAAELPAGVVYMAGLPSSQRWPEDPWMKAALARDDLRVCVGLEVHRDRTGPWLAVPPSFARVDVPPLAARFDELPRRIERLVHEAEPQMEIDVTLVEACFLYDWTGGIPELERACAEAIAAARQAGKPRVTASELRSFTADLDVMASLRGEPAKQPFAGKTPFQPRQAVRGLREPAFLAYLLDVAGGDRDRVAARLGVPREAVDPWVRRHGFERDG